MVTTIRRSTLTTTAAAAVLAVGISTAGTSAAHAAPTEAPRAVSASSQTVTLPESFVRTGATEDGKDLGWWITTATGCGLEVAPVIASGGTNLAFWAPRLLAAVQHLAAESPEIAAALKDVGRLDKAAAAVIIHVYLSVRAKLPSELHPYLPPASLTDAEKKFAELVVAAGIGGVGALGFPSCGALVDEVI